MKNMVLLAKLQRKKKAILHKYLVASSSQAMSELVFALNTFSGYCFLPQLSHYSILCPHYLIFISMDYGFHERLELWAHGL